MRKLLKGLVCSSRSSRSSQKKLKRHRDYLKDAKARFDERYGASLLCPAVDIGYFQLTRPISEGDLANLYEARLRLAPERLYAVKARDKAKCVEKVFVARAVEEKKILFAARSDFIIKLYYTARDCKNIFLVMEYAPKGNLSGFKDRSKNAVRRIAAQVVLGLEYLHTCKVVHRDLQPENILLFPGNRVKLGGLGWACLVDKLPAAGQPGHPKFTAPECYRGGYGLPSDWWSLGILIFNLLTDEFPFDGSRATFAIGTPFVFPEKPRLGEKTEMLLDRLITYDVEFRLGEVKDGESNIRGDPWFEKTDFTEFLHAKPEVEKEYKDRAPFKGSIPIDKRPKVKGDPHDHLFLEFGIKRE